MGEQHKAIFSKLGLSNDEIDAIEKVTLEKKDGKDVLPDAFKADDYVTKITGTYKTKFLNDNSFLSEIPVDRIPAAAKQALETGQYERFLTEMKDVAKEMGIPIDQIPAEDQRSIKKLARGTITKYFETKGGDKTITELQGKLSTALAEKTKAESDAEGKVTTATEREKKKVNAIVEKLVVSTEIGAIPKVKVKPTYIASGVLEKLKAKYNLEVNADAMEINLKQKDNDKLDVLKSDGSKLLLKDALQEILTADDLIDQSEAPKDKSKETVIVKVNGEKANPVASYIDDKMQKAIEAEKKNQLK